MQSMMVSLGGVDSSFKFENAFLPEVIEKINSSVEKILTSEFSEGKFKDLQLLAYEFIMCLYGRRRLTDEQMQSIRQRRGTDFLVSRALSMLAGEMAKRREIIVDIEYYTLAFRHFVDVYVTERQLGDTVKAEITEKMTQFVEILANFILLAEERAVRNKRTAEILKTNILVPIMTQQIPPSEFKRKVVLLVSYAIEHSKLSTTEKLKMLAQPHSDDHLEKRQIEEIASSGDFYFEASVHIWGLLTSQLQNALIELFQTQQYSNEIEALLASYIRNLSLLFDEVLEIINSIDTQMRAMGASIGGPEAVKPSDYKEAFSYISAYKNLERRRFYQREFALNNLKLFVTGFLYPEMINNSAFKPVDIPPEFDPVSNVEALVEVERRKHEKDLEG